MTLRELQTIIDPHTKYEVREKDGTIWKNSSSDFSDWANDDVKELPSYVRNSEIYHIFTRDDSLVIVLKGLGDK